jgi:hypothetical protein
MSGHETYFFSDSPANIERTPDGKLAVSGWSVHKGIYQDGMVEIPVSELQNIANSLVGKHLFRDHQVSTSSAVGRVSETRVGIDRKVGKSGVKYKGTIKDPELEEKIADGLVDNVSIGFKLFPECSVCGEDFSYCEHWFDEAHVIARDCECYEQSFVPIGADNQTTVEPAAAFVAGQDFTLQFAYKQKKMEKNNMKTNNPQTFTTDNTNQPPINITIPSITVPPVDTTWTYGGFSANNKPEDGEKMEELEKVQKELKETQEELVEFKNKYSQVKTELEDAVSQADVKDTKIAELEDKIGTITVEKTDVEAKLGDTETKLQNYVDAETEAVELAIDTLKREIVDLQVEKKIITEELTDEQVSSKIEELTDDEATLKQMKGMLEAIVVESEEEVPPVGQFRDENNGKPAMPTEREKFDMEDEELRRNMFRKALGYKL